MFIDDLFEPNKKNVREDSWSDGTNAWSSEHDQWAKEETIPALTGVGEAADPKIAQLQATLENVQKLAPAIAEFAKGSKYEFAEIESNLYRLDETVKQANLGDYASDVSYAIKDAVEKVNEALSSIYAVHDEINSAARNIQISIEDLELNSELDEDAEGLQIGDPVIITGNVNFNGSTGDIVDFGRDKRFVVVNLYNFGKHSFHSSDVSYNDYADSGDEEARMYDTDKDARNWMHSQEMDESHYTGYNAPFRGVGGARGREDDEGWENEKNNNYWNKPRSNKPELVGMYFYNNVTPADEQDALTIGLKKTKSGKWALAKYTTSGATFVHRKIQADKAFGQGRWWEKKGVTEESHQYHVVSKLDGNVLASYKTKEEAHKNAHGNPVVSGSLETIGDRQYVREQGVTEGSDNITAVFSGYGNYMKGRGTNVFKHYGITVLDKQYFEDEDIAEYTVSGSKEALDQARAYLERSDQFGGMILKQGVAAGSGNGYYYLQGGIEKSNKFASAEEAEKQVVAFGNEARVPKVTLRFKAPGAPAQTVKTFSINNEQGVAEGRVTNTRVNEIRQLAKEFFGNSPYSSGVISGGKILRLSFPYNWELEQFYRYVPFSKVTPQDQQVLKDMKAKFEQFMASKGVGPDEVSLKFHIGSGVYAGVRIAIPQEQGAVDETGAYIVNDEVTENSNNFMAQDSTSPVGGHVNETQGASSAVYDAIVRRIIGAHPSLVSKYGPEAVMQAVEEVAEWNNDVEEIGTSDVSNWVRQVFSSLSGKV